MRPREQTHFRAEVGRFGGMINAGHATAIPNGHDQPAGWQPAADGVPLWGEGSNFSPARSEFLTRHKPEIKSYGAGVPGYAGFKAHGKNNPFETELFAPHKGLSGNHAIDVSGQPYAMPVVGYSGHLRNHRGDAWKSFGTTHWKNSGKTGTKPAAAKIWDNRDSAGRPFGGWTPKDGGVYSVEPDYDQKVKEAEEALELMNLRSMGIRAAQEKVKYTAKSPPGLSW